MFNSCDVDKWITCNCIIGAGFSGECCRLCQRQVRLFSGNLRWSRCRKALPERYLLQYLALQFDSKKVSAHHLLQERFKEAWTS